MLHEVESVRRFVGLKLSGPLPDETTILGCAPRCSLRPTFSGGLLWGTLLSNNLTWLEWT